MELQFNKRLCSCLDTALREVQNLEQTQEIRLPDAMPDLGRILAAWGQPMLRSKEWRPDGISLSGGMQVWVLYAPEDGTQPRCIDSWIPFQMRWDLPEDVEEGKLRIGCRMRFVDARSVSARKIMVRAGVAAMAEAFSPMEAQIYIPENVPEGVELLKRVYPVRLPREAGEKTFLIDEELTVPPSVPQPEKLVYYTIHPVCTDQKVMGNKIVFRGNSILHILFVSEEGQLHSWDFELPVSQFAELDGSYSTDAQTDVVMCPTSLELTLEDEGHLRLKCGIVAQYLVEDPELLELVEDAYSPGRELNIHSQMLELPVILETRQENLYGEQSIPGNANIVTDTQLYLDYPRQRRSGDQLEMEVPGTFQVLYYGEDGALQSSNARWEGQMKMAADENSNITAVPGAVLPQVSIGNDTMTVRAEMSVQMKAAGTQEIPMVTGLVLGEQLQPSPNRPSLVLRRMGDGCLWDIAKATGSTMDAIRSANGLEGEPAPNQMLLIPVF